MEKLKILTSSHVAIPKRFDHRIIIALENETNFDNYFEATLFLKPKEADAGAEDLPFSFPFKDVIFVSPYSLIRAEGGLISGIEIGTDLHSTVIANISTYMDANVRPLRIVNEIPYCESEIVFWFSPHRNITFEVRNGNTNPLTKRSFILTPGGWSNLSFTGNIGQCLKFCFTDEGVGKEIVKIFMYTSMLCTK
uniref:ORF9 n=1 Tax=Carrot yellow leaf virus TaxID=656190 RepID=A0A0A0P9K5_9CLOS|nr:ORF9 [Carrot yellow leaf virus]